MLSHFGEERKHRWLSQDACQLSSHQASGESWLWENELLGEGLPAKEPREYSSLDLVSGPS